MIKWNNIENGLPEQDEAIILSKTIAETISNADIGRLLINEKGVHGWFVGNNLKILEVGARRHWIYMQDSNIDIPDFETDDELLHILQEAISRLSFYEEKFLLLSKSMFASGNGV